MLFTGKFESLREHGASASPPLTISPTTPSLSATTATPNSAVTAAAVAAAAAGANFIDFTRLIATNNAFTSSN